MVWGYGMGNGWMWLWGLLMLIGLAILVLLVVRMFGGLNGPGPRHFTNGTPQGRSTARRILDERLARGELTAEEYRDRVKVLGEDL
ncbi:SHOCT domain-containing protein [Paenarthrobacter aromaticivorans]|uniref:SHOCT domain-containing protein n=1 Tax=Paenarthrobacter aromaticivorans TaxID=2849150 RepID=A0ABS6I245_9MICC|nr:SHOCT domain-containing protein [Paenarthrobacter sp. MMS21-TAE1-1]MBU8865811.1 SHOCT domain-containing protein [Paenarthrobacter sp. MMS21-TAE1-1]